MGLGSKAFELGDDWGTLVWLVMTTGMHRAEVAGRLGHGGGGGGAITLRV
jgi:hypothetical protein